jgi:hypothetical protein
MHHHHLGSHGAFILDSPFELLSSVFVANTLVHTFPMQREERQEASATAVPRIINLIGEVLCSPLSYPDCVLPDQRRIIQATWTTTDATHTREMGSGLQISRRRIEVCVQLGRRVCSGASCFLFTGLRREILTRRAYPMGYGRLVRVIRLCDCLRVLYTMSERGSRSVRRTRGMTLSNLLSYAKSPTVV